MANTSTRTVAEIEAEIAAARKHLSEGVTALIEHVHPKAVAGRGVANVCNFATQKAQRLRKSFIDDEGNLDSKRVAVVGAGVVGAVAAILLIRVLARRR